LGYLGLAQPAAALPYFERELALRSRNYASKEGNVIGARLQIARTRCLMGDIDNAVREWNSAIEDYASSTALSRADEAAHAAYFAACLLDAGRADSARAVMVRHGKRIPTGPAGSKRDRAEVAAVWKRLEGQR